MATLLPQIGQAKRYSGNCRQHRTPAACAQLQAVYGTMVDSADAKPSALDLAASFPGG